MKALEISGLCKKYPGFELDNVVFSVEKGHIMGFIGRNGAGKTTTLKSLLNLVHPDAGEIRFFGRSFSEDEFGIKRRIGYVSGGFDFYEKKKLAAITAVTRRFYPEWDDAAYRGYIKRFALDEKKTPSELSAGMRVKYSLALALSHKAELLILDEPTSGLDPVSREDLLDLFLELEDEGTGILFSTHITSDLEKCADDVTYIRRGKILRSEPLAVFAGRYRLAELTDAELKSLGSAERALLIGCKRAKEGHTALVESGAAARFIRTSPATLDDVMVHFEKEGDDDE